MDLPDPKALKKLADACRKAGITSFKGNGFEFTLGDKPGAAKPKAAPEASGNDSFSSDSISEEALLFWSVGGDNNIPGGPQ